MNRVALSLLLIVAPLAAARAQDTTSSASREAPTYFEFQVERTALPLPGMRGVQYPPELRAQHVEGTVLAQFVVDVAGKPDMRTFKPLRSSNDLFTRAVYDAVKQMRFQPAQVGGKAVRQVVQQPFVFSLGQ